MGQAQHQILSDILHSTLPQHLVQGVTSVDRRQAPVCTCSTSVSNHRCVATAAMSPLADQWNAGAVRHAFLCTMYTTVLMTAILSNENFYRSARDAVAQSGFLAHMRSWGEGGGRSSELCLCDIYSLCVFTVLISLQRSSKEKN